MLMGTWNTYYVFYFHPLTSSEKSFWVQQMDLMARNYEIATTNNFASGVPGTQLDRPDGEDNTRDRLVPWLPFMPSVAKRPYLCCSLGRQTAGKSILHSRCGGLAYRLRPLASDFFRLERASCARDEQLRAQGVRNGKELRHRKE